MSKTTLVEWNRAMAECGLSSEQYAQRQIALDEELPWVKIDSGIPREQLVCELNAALI